MLRGIARRKQADYAQPALIPKQQPPGRAAGSTQKPAEGVFDPGRYRAGSRPVMRGSIDDRIVAFQLQNDPLANAMDGDDQFVLLHACKRLGNRGD